MATEARNTDYWISHNAISIQLNALGDPDYVQCNTISGASILCYMKDIDGLGYDAGHNYQRWSLAAYSSKFYGTGEKYIYVAIPRSVSTNNGQAMLVFPSQRIDIYGMAVDDETKQIGSSDYYYIYLQGIISEVYTNDENKLVRSIKQEVDWGVLSTDEGLSAKDGSNWWEYNSVSDTVSFLKTILSATFEKLTAKYISVKQLFFGDNEINGVADEKTSADDNTKIVTPQSGQKYFLSKQRDDTANGFITFLKGIASKELAELLGGATFGNSGASIDNLGSAILSSLRSLDYANAAEQGFSIEKEAGGKYHQFITNLTVWGKAVFHELEIRKLSYAGGNIYLSGAGSKIVKVVPVKWSNASSSWAATTEDECEGWKCYLLADDGTTATMNYWQEGDQVRCQTMGEIASAGTYEDAANKAYWRTIPDNGVSTANEKIYGTTTETYTDDDGNEQTREVQVELYDGQGFAWIVIGKHSVSLDGYTEDTAPTETKDYPAAGDTIVLDGNRHRDSATREYDKEDRQNVILLETTGDDAPRIAGYYHITEYKHTYTDTSSGEEVPLYVFLLSAKEGVKLNSSRFEWIAADGSTINMPNYRGDWSEGTAYYKNDEVSHGNAVWICVANSGTAVTDEPTSTSANWKMVINGGEGTKGDKGDKGDDGVMYQINIYSDNGTSFVNGLGEMTLTATLLKNGEDITDTIPSNCWSWYRLSSNTANDTIWNGNHEGIGNTCDITSEDVDRMAQFGCRAYESDAASNAKRLMADSMDWE